MNAANTALVYVGVLLAMIGLFVAGNIVLIALGVVSLFGAAFFQALTARGR